MIETAKLKALLRYVKSTGVFTWRVSRPGHVKVGDRAGNLAKDGRWYIKTGGKRYQASRLAWQYVTGEVPPLDIDHIDTDPGNDRWKNLRLLTKAHNAQNHRHATVRSTTGLLGARPTASGRFQAVIGHAGKTIPLGTFDTPEEAHAAHVAAKRLLHPGNTL